MEEPKMVEQEPVIEEEPPPQAAAPEQPPSDLTTNLKGDGPNNFGLAAGNGRGGGGQIGGTGSGRGGSKFGWYASGVQSVVADALRRHPSTRNSSLSLKIRIWPDATGRVTRAQLVESTGSPALDETLKNQILTGLQLKQGPPADMPLPIVLRLTARKP
jgi:outer membrane biosynthesis protein TonB